MAARKRSPFHRDIDEQVEATFHARTNADGELDLEDVIGDLTAWFVGHPRVLQEEARRVATALARQFDEGRRPRPSAGPAASTFSTRSGACSRTTSA